MSETKIFRGFLSYAHHDALTDPELFETFRTELENRVNAKLTNARFEIWRDRDGLRTGDRWDDKIEAELRKSDILVVVVTPRWIGSNYCRKEYAVFEDVEHTRLAGFYVAPILVREVEHQAKHFDEAQKNTYEELKSRQYASMLIEKFYAISDAERKLLVERIADDITGMIERRRSLPPTSDPADRVSRRRPSPAKEFSAQAYSYESVDFVTSREVVIDRPNAAKERGVYAQVGFLERLYVEGERSRIEFGVRRAHLSIVNGGPGELSQSDHLRGMAGRYAARYVTRHDAPEAITVSMNPEAGKTTLAELALPPSPNENYWSQVATATADVETGHLKAELTVSLSPEGLLVSGDKGGIPSRATRDKIEAIMAVAAKKNRPLDGAGQIRIPIPVKERSR